jgi:putative SOS response-associated peptidase YedK
MCYSARIVADYRKYTKDYGAEMSIKEFVELFWKRTHTDPKTKIPKAVADAFKNPRSDDEVKIKDLIANFDAMQTVELEQDLFKQRKRLADAERTLLTKTTKAATESKRIAAAKVEWALGKLADIRRSDLVEEDSRIFPGWYAPVMVMVGGKRVIKPMRYQCRLAGKPAAYDVKFPGTYNARRDNLEGFWRAQFGYTHGLVVMDSFFENVNRHKAEGRDLGAGEEVENLILEFKPQSSEPMLAACLWSRWSAPGEPELLSFAAITDEPPPEVAAAGHDRCVIPIKPGHIDAWLKPDPKNLKALYAILDDRERPYYEHRLAA